jgi:exopolysaccharide biosynthesis protein
MTYQETHERICLKNGKLAYLPIATRAQRIISYGVPASDVRFIKFKISDIRMQLVWSVGSKVSQLVKSHGADFGINAPFFYLNEPVADCVIDGKIVNSGYGKMLKWRAFTVKDGVAKFGYADTKDGYDIMIKTSPFLVSNGLQVWDWAQKDEHTATDIGRDSNGNLVRAQRTFGGVDKNGDLIICVSDGRTSSDIGLTIQEQSLYLIDKGVINGQNFDGGSSSDLSNKTGMLNAQPRGEVPVNHALLFFVNK